MSHSANITIMQRAAEKAAKSLLRDFGEVEHLQVSKKGPANFVSAADRRAEEILVESLSKSRPGYSFLLEEGGEVKGSDAEYRFIIDPLDGTTNFLHSIPHWNISIGLERQGEIIAGLVMDPIKNETFFAEKGLGAYLDKRRLRVSTRSDLSLAIISGGDGVRLEKDIRQNILEKIKKITGVTSGYRRMGAAALDLCYVASGRYEAYFEYHVQPWDVAAGGLIVKEAGGQFISLSENPNPVYSGDVLATNSALFQTIKELLS
jgi:myo-inositol-1(or 4)-monophosphatase